MAAAVRLVSLCLHWAYRVRNRTRLTGPLAFRCISARVAEPLRRSGG